MTTKTFTLIGYLVTLFSSASTLGQATPPVTVLDGPATTELDDRLKLYVGLTDPDSDAAEEAATWTQTRIDMGTGRREDIIVRCVAEAWSGEDTVSTLRTSVAGIVTAAEALVRADTTQFGGNATFVPQQAATYSLLQNNTSVGVIARVPFDLQFQSFT